MSPRSEGIGSSSQIAALFAALGDETRLALVDHLVSEGPQSITQLTAESGVTRQAITKHLEILAEAGLARDSRRGRERIWRLETGRLAEAHLLLDRIAAQWDAALGRLARFVEDDERSHGED